MLLHQVCGKIFHRILKNQWPKFSILKVLSNETKHRFLALMLKKWELVKDNLFRKSLFLVKWLCQWYSQLWWTTESKRIDRFSSAWSRSLRFFKIFNLVYYFFNFDQYNGWYNDLKNLAIYLTHSVHGIFFWLKPLLVGPWRNYGRTDPLIEMRCRI